MIFIEQQFTSLEISRKLFELKIDLKTLFYWEVYSDTAYGLTYLPYCIVMPVFIPEGIYKKYPAFTPSDIFSLLPIVITIKENEPFDSFRIRLEKSTIVENDVAVNVFVVNYYCDSTECFGPDAWLVRKLFEHNEYDKNLSDCLGKLLIKVREDNRLK